MSMVGFPPNYVGPLSEAQYSCQSRAHSRNCKITHRMSCLQFDKFRKLVPHPETRRHSEPSMEHMRSRSRERLSASLAAHTQIAYKHAVTAFNKFRMHHNLNIHWPAAVTQVQYFMSSCFEKGFSPATICTYCSGISFFHKIRNNFSDPTNTCFI